uniref:Uncharacterized protein n=1 Tax=Cajanus cajan TaxID=3821 RepID=A0A151T175_CAJCA|nr:hypothetical protein KK1_023219 [Cajanus cajan]
MSRCFKLVSGLKVNFIKSKFGALGMKSNFRVSYAMVLNCKFLKIPFVYLKISIGFNPRKVATWESVIRKFIKKLSVWKHKIFSISSRIYLINLVLTSLCFFFLSFFKMPNQVVHKIVTL